MKGTTECFATSANNNNDFTAKFIQENTSYVAQGNQPIDVFLLGASQLAILYQEHQQSQETEEKLCKWANADKLKAYEQNLFDLAGKSVAEMLESWQNPVFRAPEKVSSITRLYFTPNHPNR